MKQEELFNKFRCLLEGLLIKSVSYKPDKLNWEDGLKSSNLVCNTKQFVINDGDFSAKFTLGDDFDYTVEVEGIGKYSGELTDAEYGTLIRTCKAVKESLDALGEKSYRIESWIEAVLTKSSDDNNNLVFTKYDKEKSFLKSCSDKSSAFWQSLLSVSESLKKELKDSAISFKTVGNVREVLDKVLFINQRVELDTKGIVTYSWSLNAPRLQDIEKFTGASQRINNSLSVVRSNIASVLEASDSHLSVDNLIDYISSESWVDVEDLKRFSGVSDERELISCVGYVKHYRQQLSKRQSLEKEFHTSKSGCIQLLEVATTKGSVYDFIALGRLIDSYLQKTSFTESKVSVIRDTVDKGIKNSSIDVQEALDSTIEILEKFMCDLGFWHGTPAVLYAMSSSLISDGSPAGDINILDDFLSSTKFWDALRNHSTELPDENVRELVFESAV